MSFPYYLDVIFGSEESTVDSLGRLSFGDSNGGGGSGGNKTNSFLVSTLLYHLCCYEPSPSEDAINNRYIVELDPLTTSMGEYILTLSFVLLDSEDRRVSPEILGDFNFHVSRNNGGLCVDFAAIKGNETTVTTSISYNGNFGYFYRNLSQIEVEGTFYDLTISGVARLVSSDGTINPYGDDVYVEVQDIGYTKKNYNYITNAHLENVEIEIQDPSMEDTINSWWNSKPTISSQPYPLTEIKTFTRLVFTPDVPDGLYRYENDSGIEGTRYTMSIISNEDDHVCATFSGDIVFDTPSEVVPPIGLPVYMELLI